tara:strand:- start:23 stop:271 length:249 start_codon:yes stop_codon:yes gene_type:complete
MNLNKQQFRDYLIEEPMVDDLIQFLKDNFIDDVDSEWLISILERSSNAFIVECINEDFDVVEGPLTHSIFRSLHKHNIYSLS